MDYNELMDRIAKAEADLNVFSKELMERRLNDDENISETITTNVSVAHSSLYISRITFEQVCKSLNNLEKLGQVKQNTSEASSTV